MHRPQPPAQPGAPLNYINILQDLVRFRGSARSTYAYFDFPGQVFFKIIFHFNNASDAFSGEPVSSAPGSQCSTSYGDYALGGATQDRMTGLLGPSWLRYPSWSWDTITSPANVQNLWEDSTAWNYFAQNDDRYRAECTRQFAELLSSINTHSPWYFQKISGLENAINREVVGKDFMMKDEREKITIECLEDAYDQRIGTLLDLYRSIVWSWETKREMLPRNLRKFDMTIVAFQMPVKGKDVPRQGKKFSEAEVIGPSRIIETPAGYAAFYDDEDSGSAQLVSYKAFELHGCEIDYNTSKTGQQSLDNIAGDMQKYNIDIFFDDMYEVRFNEFLGGARGAYISDIGYDKTANDMWGGLVYDSDGSARVNKETGELEDGDLGFAAGSGDNAFMYKKDIAQYQAPSTLAVGKEINVGKTFSNSSGNIFGGKRKYGTSILDQIVGGLKEYGKTQIKKIYLGNISGLSLSRVRQQIESALDGNLGATVGAVKQYIRGNWNGGTKADLSGRDIFPDPIPPTQHQLGNIFKANTVLNTL